MVSILVFVASLLTAVYLVGLALYLMITGQSSNEFNAHPILLLLILIPWNAILALKGNKFGKFGLILALIAVGASVVLFLRLYSSPL